jgi:beta-carotene ketolase (CrtW type)
MSCSKSKSAFWRKIVEVRALQTLDTDPRLQTAVGLALALALMGALIASEVWALGFFRFEGGGWLLAPGLVALLSWLFVGLFIVAHDCMHGALAPRLPGLERPLGHLCVWLYAALDYDALRAAHRLHHALPGTSADPDFAPSASRTAFWPWYLRFLRRYVSVRQLIGLTAVFHVSVMLGAPIAHLIVFWFLPAILSSLQLFLFGTYLPHRPSQRPFLDDHRARSSAYPAWLSLLTCFHFGLHHEHHLHPATPWWRLPALRRRLRGASR